MNQIRRAASLTSPRALSASGSVDALALLRPRRLPAAKRPRAALRTDRRSALRGRAQSIVGRRGDVAEDVLQELVYLPRVLAVGASI